MNKLILLAVLGLGAGSAAAQEAMGQVLSATPVIQQVAVPRQVCSQAPVLVQQPQTSGGGGILGAIAGAAIGSQFGGGSGRGVAAVLGTVGGAMLGNSIEANAAGPAYALPACTTQTSYENRTVGYNVTYEYAGRQHTVQLPYDPGPTIRLQVSPVGAGAPLAPLTGQPGPVLAPPIAAAPILLPAPVVGVPIYAQPLPAPVYPVYAPVYRPYPPAGVSLHFGISSHRHRGYWR